MAMKKSRNSTTFTSVRRTNCFIPLTSIRAFKEAAEEVAAAVVVVAVDLTA